MVFESRVLRRIFRPKRGEVTGSWRKLHCEELHSSYCSPDIIKIMRLAEYAERMEELRNAYKIWIENEDIIPKT
jgi:hypothetical protein